MEISEAIYNELVGTAGITALVADRIYAGRMAQGSALPYIVIERISADRNPHQSGPSGLVMVRYQVDCLAISPAAAEALAKLVRIALNQFTGTMGGVGGVNVRSTSLESDFEDFDDDQSGGQLGIARYILEFRISYMEDTS